MRLFTHNMLQCNVNSKKCPTGLKYPLDLQVDEWEPLSVEYNQEFLEMTVLTRLDWSALSETCKNLGWPHLKELEKGSLDSETPEKDIKDEMAIEKNSSDVFLVPGTEGWWRCLHEILLERRIKSGHMKCKGCQHIFPIKESIPNMLLANEEA